MQLLTRSDGATPAGRRPRRRHRCPRCRRLRRRRRVSTHLTCTSPQPATQAHEACSLLQLSGPALKGTRDCAQGSHAVPLTLTRTRVAPRPSSLPGGFPVERGAQPAGHLHLLRLHQRRHHGQPLRPDGGAALPVAVALRRGAAAAVQPRTAHVGQRRQVTAHVHLVDALQQPVSPPGCPIHAPALPGGGASTRSVCKALGLPRLMRRFLSSPQAALRALPGSRGGARRKAARCHAACVQQGGHAVPLVRLAQSALHPGHQGARPPPCLSAPGPKPRPKPLARPNYYGVRITVPAEAQSTWPAMLFMLSDAVRPPCAGMTAGCSAFSQQRAPARTAKLCPAHCPWKQCQLLLPCSCAQPRLAAPTGSRGVQPGPCPERCLPVSPSAAPRCHPPSPWVPSTASPGTPGGQMGPPPSAPWP